MYTIFYKLYLFRSPFPDPVTETHQFFDAIKDRQLKLPTKKTSRNLDMGISPRPFGTRSRGTIVTKDVQGPVRYSIVPLDRWFQKAEEKFPCISRSFLCW